MKKNVKKYNDFINESTSEIDEINSDREDFETLVRELHDEMYVGRRSYSDLCKTDQDPDQDFNEMQSFMDSKGFTIDKIKELFSERNNSLCGENIINLYFLLDDLSATIDVYFYKLFEKLGLDENIVSLGGGWCDWTNGGEEEALIRYRYGYHQTKYGQLMLKQCGKTAEDLKSEAMADLKSEVKNDFDSIISQIIRKVTGKRIELSLRYDDYVVLDTDRMIIFCDEIAKKINQNISDLIRFNNNKEVDVEDVSSEFVKELSWFKLSENDDSMQLIDGDLILHGDFGL